MNSKEMITIMQLEAGAKVVRALYLTGNEAPSAPMAPAPAGYQSPPMPGRVPSNPFEEEFSDHGYCFKNVIGLDLHRGDLIVAETRNTFALLRVVNPDVLATDVGCDLEDLKHVVAKVNNDHFKGVKENEAAAIRQLALSEVTSKLNDYRNQVGENAFTMVAGLLGATDEVIEPPE
jgi:hypothetical protein